MESKASIVKGLNHCKDFKSNLQNAFSLMSFVAMEGIWTGGNLLLPPISKVGKNSQRKWQQKLALYTLRLKNYSKILYPPLLSDFSEMVPPKDRRTF